MSWYPSSLLGQHYPRRVMASSLSSAPRLLHSARHLPSNRLLNEKACCSNSHHAPRNKHIGLCPQGITQLTRNHPRIVYGNIGSLCSSHLATSTHRSSYILPQTVKTDRIDPFVARESKCATNLCRSNSLPQLNLHSFYPVSSVLKPVSATDDDIVISPSACTYSNYYTEIPENPYHIADFESGALKNAVHNATSLESLAFNERDPEIFDWKNTGMCASSPGVALLDAVREFQSQMSQLENDSSVLLASGGNEKSDGKPSQEQLQKISDVLSDDLPNLFDKSMDYSIFHQDLIFENNLRGTKSVGLKLYISQMVAVRAFSVCRFASVRLQILQMQARANDGSIRVRWRIRGVPLLRAMLSYLRLTEASETWYDGYSTYHVSSDGLVYKHVIDEIIPDDERKLASPRSSLLARLARALPLSTPQPAPFSSLMSETTAPWKG